MKDKLVAFLMKVEDVSQIETQEVMFELLITYLG